MTVGIWARPNSSDVSLPPDVFDTFEDADAPGYTATPARDWTIVTDGSSAASADGTRDGSYACSTFRGPRPLVLYGRVRNDCPPLRAELLAVLRALHMVPLGDKLTIGLDCMTALYLLPDLPSGRWYPASRLEQVAFDAGSLEQHAARADRPPGV